MCFYLVTYDLEHPHNWCVPPQPFGDNAKARKQPFPVAVPTSAPHPCTGRPHLQLLPRVQGAHVDFSVKLGADVIERAVVPEGPPLHVDAHSSLVALYHVNVTHLLHVAGITASTWSKEGTVRPLPTGTLGSHPPPSSLLFVCLGAEMPHCSSWDNAQAHRRAGPLVHCTA